MKKNENKKDLRIYLNKIIKKIILNYEKNFLFFKIFFNLRIKN
jgi:hypothetical protein